MAPEDVLSSVDEGRRDFVRKLIGGTVFAVPLIASFSMEGLSVDPAEASFTANQLTNVQVVPIDSTKIRGVPTFQAKFICGTTFGPSLARGTYFTSINVRNTTDDSLTFTQKVVQTDGSRIISDPTDHTLNPEAGLEINCNGIRSAIGASGSALVEGFVVITIPREKQNALEVVAVYTAQSA